MNYNDYIYQDYVFDYKIIESSDLFDSDWYISQYGLDSQIDTIKHFLLIGCKNNYKPFQDFDMKWYLTEYNDVKEAGFNPFIHYILFGQFEGRIIKPVSFDSKYKPDYRIILASKLFDKDWFLKFYNLDETVDPIAYYLEHGVENSLNPSQDFDTEWYSNEYKDIIEPNMNPFIHYIVHGKNLGCLPKQYNGDLKYQADYATIVNSGLFDEDWFLKFYNLDESIDPIEYYLEHGVENSLNPSRDFDTEWYMKENIDVKNSNINPFIHFIKYGKNEGRLPKLYKISEINNLNLKKTIQGRNNYYFLINDSNNELKQHYSNGYNNKFQYNQFIADYNFKKSIFEKMGIKYFYFIVPDKSVVCKDLLPFDELSLKRNIDSVDLIDDFTNHLDSSCYWPNDSHLNLKGAKILSFDFLNKIDDSFKLEDYNELIEKCNVHVGYDPSDLIHYINWSYSYNERLRIKPTSLQFHIPKNIWASKVPEEFSRIKPRHSEFYNNPTSFSKAKALVFRDSSSTNLKFYLSLYFRKLFLYWDYMNLNLELIDWYKPDVIIEIRVERFLEDYITPDWIEKFTNE